MNDSQNNAVAAVVMGGVVAVAAVVMWLFQPEREPIREALGRAFNRPVQLIELNLPPADGRYPGAVLVTPRPGQNLPLRRAYRPNDIPIHATSLRASFLGEAEAALSSSIFGSAASAGDVTVEIKLAIQNI